MKNVAPAQWRVRSTSIRVRNLIKILTSISLHRITDDNTNESKFYLLPNTRQMSRSLCFSILATTRSSSRRPFSGSTARARQRTRRNPPRVTRWSPRAFLKTRSWKLFSRVSRGSAESRGGFRSDIIFRLPEGIVSSARRDSRFFFVAAARKRAQQRARTTGNSGAVACKSPAFFSDIRGGNRTLEAIRPRPLHAYTYTIIKHYTARPYECAGSLFFLPDRLFTFEIVPVRFKQTYRNIYVL